MLSTFGGAHPTGRRWAWALAEAAVGLAVLGWGAGAWWSPPGWAQGGNTTTTFTTSTTQGTTFVSCPPSVAHQETSVTTDTTIGPATILIGENQSVTFFVAAGTLNINTNTHTQFFVCLAAQVPALPGVLGVAVAALGAGALGLWRLRRRHGQGGVP